MKKVLVFGALILLCVTKLLALDVVEAANREFLTLEETITLAEKEPSRNKELISKLKKLKKLSDTSEIYELIDRCPYMPCTEAIRILNLSSEDLLNSANYIYSVFSGCPENNALKDQVYLKILEASVSQNDFSWSYNAARDLSEEGKKTDIYKTFSEALSKAQ